MEIHPAARKQSFSQEGMVDDECKLFSPSKSCCSFDDWNSVPGA